VQDLTAKLSVAEENWKNLCRSSQWIANLLRMPEDEGKSWGQFASLIPVRLQDFLKEAAHACVKNIFSHIRVLAPSTPLEKLVEEAESQEYLDKVEQVESEVEDLARQFVDQMDMQFPPADDEA